MPPATAIGITTLTSLFDVPRTWQRAGGVAEPRDGVGDQVDQLLGTAPAQTVGTSSRAVILPPMPTPPRSPGRRRCPRPRRTARLRGVPRRGRDGPRVRPLGAPSTTSPRRARSPTSVHRRAAEVEPAGQLRACQRAVAVDVAERQRQVVLPDVVWPSRNSRRSARAHPQDMAARRREIASTAAASSSTTPVMTYCHCGPRLGLRPRPLGMIAITRAPMMASRGLPRPPNSDVPPMTAAATENSSTLPEPRSSDADDCEDASSDAAERTERRAQDERGDLDVHDVDAGTTGRLGVAAGGVEVSAPRRLRQRDRAQDHQRDHDDGRPRDALMILNGLVLRFWFAR